MEILEFLSGLFFIILLGSISIGSILQIWQDLKMRKLEHDKEIKRLEEMIQNNKLVTMKTIEHLESCIISNLNKGE